MEKKLLAIGTRVKGKYGKGTIVAYNLQSYHAVNYFPYLVKFDSVPGQQMIWGGGDNDSLIVTD